MVSSASQIQSQIPLRNSDAIQPWLAEQDSGWLLESDAEVENSVYPGLLKYNYVYT